MVPYDAGGSRSLMHLLEVVKTFDQQGIALLSLRENIDTSTATGRCFLAMIGAMSQMERELKAERTAAGRAAAKARGRTGGRPRTDPDKLAQARILYLNSDKTAAEVCRSIGIGRRTLFSSLAQTRRQDSHHESQQQQKTSGGQKEGVCRVSLARQQQSEHAENCRDG